ncbi:MAG: hypothetical protein RR751_06675 [Clostridia bacterium]
MKDNKIKEKIKKIFIYIKETKYLLLSICICFCIVYAVFNAENIIKTVKTVAYREKTKNEILNVKTYYAEYSSAIFSNKTINRYSICEWYKSENMQKIEYTDMLRNKVQNIVNGNELYIKSENQKFKYVVKNDKFLNLQQNELSIMDYVSMYKQIKRDKGKSKAFKYAKDGKIVYEIILADSKWYNGKIVRRILKIDAKTLKPLTLTNLDNNKNIVSDIVYSVFKYNEDIKDEIFALK